METEFENENSPLSCGMLSHTAHPMMIGYQNSNKKVPPPSRNRAGDLSVTMGVTITAERHIQLDHRGFGGCRVGETVTHEQSFRSIIRRRL